MIVVWFPSIMVHNNWLTAYYGHEVKRLIKYKLEFFWLNLKKKEELIIEDSVRLCTLKWLHKFLWDVGTVFDDFFFLYSQASVCLVVLYRYAISEE